MFRLKSKNFDSRKYWNNRYAKGGNSGCGSYNEFALFKAEIINSFIKSKNIEDVIEFGCGDGNQISLINCKNYTGYDVSKKAIKICSQKYKDCKSKNFFLIDQYQPRKVQLTLSLDVIFHLVEDSIFENYMRLLFDSSYQYVLIYSSNFDKDPYGKKAIHVKHRRFTDWVSKNIKSWKLAQVIHNKYPYFGDYRKGSFSDFYIYETME